MSRLPSSLRKTRRGQPFRPDLMSLEQRTLLTGYNFLQGVAFHDFNLNTTYDQGEALPNATVTLAKFNTGTNQYDQVIGSQLTDANGVYRFTGLDAGKYRLTETPQAGSGLVNSATQTNLSRLNQVTAATTSTIDVTIGDPGPTASPNWTLTWSGTSPYDGLSFFGNGATHQDAVGPMHVSVNETDIGYSTGSFQTYCIQMGFNIQTGPTPYVAQPLDQVVTNGNAGPIAYLINTHGSQTLSTDAMAGLQLAIWQLRYGDVSNISVVPGYPGNLSNVLSAYNSFLTEAAGKTDVATYLLGTSSQAVLATGSLNFANIPGAAIGDYVWEDSNGNGVQDSGENGIPDVTVLLIDCATNQQVGSTTTDASGLYHFTGLTPGSYHVQSSSPRTATSSPRRTRAATT